MKSRIVTTMLCLIIALTAGAQGTRQYIKKSIKEWGSCRNVTITDTGGDIALNQDNQYSYSGIPTSLADAIKELHDDAEYIDDIQLTESGRWVILVGDNGFRWHNIPSALERKLREFNSDNEVVTSVALNDNGQWIVITRDHVASSDDELRDWVTDGNAEYGKAWAAHLTNTGCAVSYEDGYKFLANVPQRLKDALDDTNINVYRLKFTEKGSYFFADQNGTYKYWM